MRKIEITTEDLLLLVQALRHPTTLTPAQTEEVTELGDTLLYVVGSKDEDVIHQVSF